MLIGNLRLTIVETLFVLLTIDKAYGGFQNAKTPLLDILSGSLENLARTDHNYFPVLFRDTRQTQSRCRKTQWTCDDGQCIKFDQHCDGKYDCADHSDENAVTCRNIVCRTYLFQCEYGACIDGDAKCNGRIDCVDKSDELDRICGKSPTLPVNNCGKTSFQCNNSECIEIDELCDGVKNCRDGSDETLEQCSGNYCKSYLFKCAYGACVDGDAECNGMVQCADGSDEAPQLCNKNGTVSGPPIIPPTSQAGECTVPPIPERGRYKTGTPTTPFPGTNVPKGTVLRYECDTNYFPTSKGFIFCEDGFWNDEVFCIKPCPIMESSTVDFTCNYQGARISCDGLMLNGTVVSSKCKVRHISAQGVTLRDITCINGSWDYPTPFCVAECGEEKLKTAAQLAIGARDEFRGNSPWHVAIYKKNESGLYEQICGGTILSNRIVISAAHCFSEDRFGTILSSNLFAIGAGKYYRSWNHPDDQEFSYIQKIMVEKIVASPEYGGLEQNFQEDIALLVLEKTINFSDSVHPACFDLQLLQFKKEQISNGSLGKAVGWGVTKEGDVNSVSDVLQVVNIPVIDYKQCRNTIPASLRRYLTADKFCAGWLNGTSLCSGDSGGGLVFNTTEKGIERWYLRGIVSVSDSDETGTTCRNNVYTLFTDIFKHRDLILNVFDMYK